MAVLTSRDFETWLDAYKIAWESRDAAAAAALFTADAEYYWTPFDPPQRGPEQIAQAWQGAVSQQKDVNFTASVIAIANDRGVAQWHTRLSSVPKGERVELDGVLIAEFADARHCRVFREWWHLLARP